MTPEENDRLREEFEQYVPSSLGRSLVKDDGRVRPVSTRGSTLWVKCKDGVWRCHHVGDNPPTPGPVDGPRPDTN